MGGHHVEGPHSQIEIHVLGVGASRALRASQYLLLT